MLKQLEQHLATNFPFLKDQKLLMTVSGGVDSIVLTHLLHKLNYNIGIAHCNFGLRDTDSDGDENFVHDFAKNNSIPFHVVKFNTQEYCFKNKVSTQIGARELRYEWFQKLCNDFNYNFILTAHHLNDVIETFFINLSRGTGLDGLTGIPPINNNIVRPLLFSSRADIETYATQNNILWREDKSNAETKYLRNKIRHNIVPELYKLTPDFEKNFKTTLVNIHKSKTFINAKIAALKTVLFNANTDIIIIPKKRILQLSDFENYELFKEFGFHSSSEILKIAQAQTGKSIISTTHKLLVNRDELLLHAIKNDTLETYQIHNIHELTHLPIKLQSSTSSSILDNNTIAIDSSILEYPLTLRRRKDGDVFFPTGMTGKKKISKYFKDEKFSKLDKESCWLLCTSTDKIIWIVGHRADRTQTSNILSKNLVYLSHQ